MQAFLQNPTIFSQPIRLATAQQQNPTEVLHCFFKAYSLAAAKQHLANCVAIALSTDNLHYDQAEDRAELLRFYGLIEEVLEAAYLMKP